MDMCISMCVDTCDLGAGSLDSGFTQNVLRAGFKGHDTLGGRHAHDLCADMHLNYHTDVYIEVAHNMRMDRRTEVCKSRPWQPQQP